MLGCACAIGAVAALGACGGGGEPEQAGGGGAQPLELKIGDLLPLTGDLSDFGPPGRKAADLAVEEIRKAGTGDTVTIAHEDTQTDPQAAVSAARKAVGEGASCLAGGWASASTLAIARSVATRQRVLEISPASTSDEITDLRDRGLVNRTVPPDSFQGPALADALAPSLGGGEGKTVNVGARNDAYGTGLAKSFGNAWKAKGGRIGEQVIYDPMQPSYNSEAGKIVQGAPDAFVIVDFPETFGKVGPALVRTGDWDPAKTFVTDGLKSDSLPKDVGREATDGIRGTAPGAPDEGDAPKAFGELYEQAGGPGRQTFDAQNFDAVMLCYLSAVAAGSTDGPEMAAKVREVSGPPGIMYTFEQLGDAVKALKNGDDIDYQGASGPLDLDEAGDATSGVYDLFRYEGESLNVFDEVPVRAAGGAKVKAGG